MAFFQFRKSREEQAAKLASTQTVEAMRRRAMHRLIGAAVLVLAGVIGFPLVFDNQPRPIPVDLPIEIADKAKVKPLVAPPAQPSTDAAAVAPAAEPAPASPAVTAPAAVTAEAAPAPPKSSPPAVEKPALTSVVVEKPPVDKPAVDKAAVGKTVAKSADASKAQALLDGKSAAAAAPEGDSRYVVQVGAFADSSKIREVRQKVEGAGLKTYTQVVETKDGSRTRIRVGPFPDKAQATQVAEKLRKLDLSAVILSL